MKRLIFFDAYERAVSVSPWAPEHPVSLGNGQAFPN